MKFEKEYKEILSESHTYQVSDSPLAISMFEKYFDEISDAELERLHAEIENLKKNKRGTYDSLVKQPFSSTIFAMIQDEYGYRNQQPPVG